MVEGQKISGEEAASCKKALFVRPLVLLNVNLCGGHESKTEVFQVEMLLVGEHEHNIERGHVHYLGIVTGCQRPNELLHVDFDEANLTLSNNHDKMLI